MLAAKVADQLGGTACVLFKPPVLLNVMLE